MKTLTKDFSLILFSTLSGFLLANLFGTFLTALRQYVVWDGCIIIGLVVLIEATNLFVYKPFKYVALRDVVVREAQREVQGVLPPNVTEDLKDLVAPTKVTRFARRVKELYTPSSDTFKVSTLFSVGAIHRIGETLQKRGGRLLCQLVNSFKLGLLLGFFVEAFKVGS